MSSACRLAAWAAIGLLGLASAGAASFHHLRIISASPSEAVAWYVRHLDCDTVPGRSDAAACDGIELIFVAMPTMGSSQGTGVNRVAFSYSDLSSKMAQLEAVGVRGSGVRLQRFDDGSTFA